MKQKKLRTAVILAILLVASATTVLAASNMDFMKHFFSEAPPSVEQYVKTLQSSVTDGKFTVALEEVLAFENRAMFIYSVEGVTEEAHGRLMSGSFNGSVSLKELEGPESRYNSASQYELTDLRTETKRFFACSVEGISNPQMQPLYFSLDIMGGGDPFLEVAMDDTIEIRELTLTSPSGGRIIVKLSPMDILVEKDLPEEEEMRSSALYMDMHFRMDDDSIKTFHELFSWQSSSLMEAPARYRYSAVSYGGQDYSKIKSIIAAGWEYDLDDTTKVKAAELDESTRPFEMTMVHHDDTFMVPLEETIEKLGGEITFDETGQRAWIQYRGSSYEMGCGEDYYLKDGIKYEFYGQVVTGEADADGMLLQIYDFAECFRIMIDTRYTIPRSESVFYAIP